MRKLRTYQLNIILGLSDNCLSMLTQTLTILLFLSCAHIEAIFKITNIAKQQQKSSYQPKNQA